MAGSATTNGVAVALLGAGGNGAHGSAAARMSSMCVWRSALLAAPSWQAASAIVNPTTGTVKTLMGGLFTLLTRRKRVG
ncbi:MAG: hypothetical protein ABSC94_23140 [Polyangiaceae bacterium]|jgi:hypothetical protein